MHLPENFALRIREPGHCDLFLHQAPVFVVCGDAHDRKLLLTAVRHGMSERASAMEELIGKGLIDHSYQRSICRVGIGEITSRNHSDAERAEEVRSDTVPAQQAIHACRVILGGISVHIREGVVGPSGTNSISQDCQRLNTR